MAVTRKGKINKAIKKDAKSIAEANYVKRLAELDAADRKALREARSGAKSQSLSPKPKMDTKMSAGPAGYKPMVRTPDWGPGYTPPTRYEQSAGPARSKPMTKVNAGKKGGAGRPEGPGISRNPTKQKRGTQTTVPSGKSYDPGSNPAVNLEKAKKKRSVVRRITDNTPGVRTKDILAMQARQQVRSAARKNAIKKKLP